MFCSIIIPTFNALELTKKCVHTIFQNSSYPFEIIFIDNGSSDGTVEYLKAEGERQGRGLATHSSACRNFKIIQNRKNLGFPRACNQGVLAARGEYILLLNSDAAVTPGWLTRMIEIYKKVPNVGIVSPLSPRILNLDSMVEKNNAQGDITSELEFIKHLNSNLTYSNTAELDLFAGEIWNRYQHKALDMNTLTGFCMLLSRNIISTIGLFDEKFGIGLYEDNDYCWRVKLKGFKLVLAIGVYIHHHMSGSFTANKIDMRSVEEKNREYFFQKKAINEAAANAGSVKIDIEAKEHGIASFNRYFAIHSIRLWNKMNSGYFADVFYRNKKK